MGDETRFALDVDDRTLHAEPLTKLVGALHADTLTELVADLIPGYSEDAGEALEQRYRAAVVYADGMQAQFAAERQGSGQLDPAALSEPELTAIFASRSELAPIPGDVWEHEVPLVLVATDYEPYTDRVKPVGNVKFVDPANERTFLGSLSDLGALTLFVRDEGATT